MAPSILRVRVRVRVRFSGYVRVQWPHLSLGLGLGLGLVGTYVCNAPIYHLVGTCAMAPPILLISATFLLRFFQPATLFLGVNISSLRFTKHRR